MNKEKRRESQKRYMKEYHQRPEVIERNRLYYQRPEVKERMREYNQRPEVLERMREWQKEYRQRPEVKERMREWDNTYKKKPEVIEKARLRERKKQRNWNNMTNEEQIKEMMAFKDIIMKEDKIGLQRSL